MDSWVQILSIIVAAVVPTGGITTFFLIKGKRTELEISNLSQVIARWQDIAEDRKNRAVELKADLDRRDDKIDRLYGTISELRTDLDLERTARAVASMMICDKTKCGDRNPPFGQGIEHLNRFYGLKPILPNNDTRLQEQQSAEHAEQQGLVAR